MGALGIYVQSVESQSGELRKRNVRSSSSLRSSRRSLAYFRTAPPLRLAALPSQLPFLTPRYAYCYRFLVAELAGAEEGRNAGAARAGGCQGRLEGGDESRASARRGGENYRNKEKPPTTTSRNLYDYTRILILRV